METSETQIRYKILQAVYRGSKERNADSYRFIPELLGYTYSEMNYQLRYMKTHGLLNYTPRMLMRHYTVSLLPAGSQIVEQFEAAFFSDAPDRDAMMNAALAPLR